MANKTKQPVHHVEMTDGKRAIIQQLLQEYDIKTAEDIPILGVSQSLCKPSY